MSLRMLILLHQGLLFTHSSDVCKSVGHSKTSRHTAAESCMFGKSFSKSMARMGKLHPLIAHGNANPDSHILNSHGFILTISY